MANQYLNESGVHRHHKADVLVAGGGVIGLLTACLLAQRGAKVVLVEKNRPGKESSWAGGGILSPLYPWNYPDEINVLAAYGQKHYQEFSSRVDAETGIDPECITSGLIMADLQNQQAYVESWLKHSGQAYEWLKGISQLQELEPEMGECFTDVLWMPEVGQVRNPRLVKALLVYAGKLGVTILDGTGVKTVLTENQKAAGLLTNKGRLFADKVVIAMGAWSAQLPGLERMTVKPVLGQMIQFKTRPGLIKRLLMKNGKYIIPRKDGHVLCGSTLEMTGFSKTTSDSVKKKLYDAATEMSPILKQCPLVNHWSGLRPGSPNGVPYIGEYPGIENLYLNTGHYRYGVVMGLGSAQLLTDIIENKQSFTDPGPYSIDSVRPESAEFQSLSGR